MNKLPTQAVTETRTDDRAAGQNIRDRRVQAGLSGRQLAKLAGLSSSYLNALELGQRSWQNKGELFYDLLAILARKSK
jgi:transcriptional regulator with XRE-family HTH domain